MRILRPPAADSKPAIPPTGSRTKMAVLPASHSGVSSSSRAKPLRASAGGPSDCEPYRAVIQAKLDQQLSAQRIFQDSGGKRIHRRL